MHALLGRLEKRSVEDGPEMNNPSQQDEPENCSQAELDDRHQQPALQQLSETWDKKTAKRGKNVAC